MGKPKKSTSGPTTATVPLCTCADFYVCQCGHRPPRPSRGHKWDTASHTWTGKGHKQKGGSGQVATLALSATTTAVGQTTVEQWQRLPTQLLEDYCRKQKRPLPRYGPAEKALGRSNGSHHQPHRRYQCTLPHGKDDMKDLCFVPATGVTNDEQAQQEAALLALLTLTPTLPHERKLPEPYRTTWLQALAASATRTTPSSGREVPGNATATPHATVDTDLPLPNRHSPTSNDDNNDSNVAHVGKAKASSQLVAATTFHSRAAQQHQVEQQRRERNARIRRHEALRLANQHPQAFMSAAIRHRIEELLRQDTDPSVAQQLARLDPAEGANPEEEMDDDGDNAITVTEHQRYITGRLYAEGFTRKQAQTAYQQAVTLSGKFSSSSLDDDEHAWDLGYEHCLQWLLIHLDEAHLPEGFDPRGRTLDVVVPNNNGNNANKKLDAEHGASRLSIDNGEMQENVAAQASKYGLQPREALHVHHRSSTDGIPFETSLFDCFCEMARNKLDIVNELPSLSATDPASNKAALTDEIEVLKAIYDSSVNFYHDPLNGQTTIVLPLLDDGVLSMSVTVREGLYPTVYPCHLLISGKWPKPMGTALHVATLTYMGSAIPLGEPMIFQLHGQVQTFLAELDELVTKSLTPTVDSDLPITTTDDSKNIAQTLHGNGRQPFVVAHASQPTPSRRPRPRGTFWATKPKDTPPAKPFPSIPKSMEIARKSLPAAAAREEFLNCLKTSEKDGGRVVLVQGATGCGKSTQIPQYILEEFPADAKIVVAQPRRLAATGVATRVASERGEERPGAASIGYVVRGDSAVGHNTRLLFCTTGIVLRQLQSEGALDCITHVIIDEVHERNLDSDVLMALLKLYLPEHKHLKVILMSATLDANRFGAYWGANTPQMNIPGRTFPVDDFLLEDVLSLTGYKPPKKTKRKKQTGGSRQTLSTWNNFDRRISEEDEACPEDDTLGDPQLTRLAENNEHMNEMLERMDETQVDYDLLGRLVQHLVATKSKDDDGSILVFLSGVPEINAGIDAVKKSTVGLPVIIMPLHGGLQPKDQNRIFRAAPTGSTKIILSTNVAETSITIPDCTVVIDTAREKLSSYDPVNRMPLLVERFASKASLMQRRGRAGRVRNGRCFKLISQRTYDMLDEHGEAEIMRCALEQTLLLLIFLGVENGAGSFTRTLLDPPEQISLLTAVKILFRIGAVESNPDGALSISPLGIHLAALPVPPTVGKLLVMGSILGCRTAAVAMAAGMSVGRSPWLRIDNPRRNSNKLDEKEAIEDFKNRAILDERLKLFKECGNSDHALLAAACMKWKDTSPGAGHRKNWCNSVGLSFAGMQEMTQITNQLDSALSHAGFPASEVSDQNSLSWRIIHACAISAMSPGQLVKVVRPATTYHETAQGAKETESEAARLKLFIQNDAFDERIDKRKEERVFIHPSSANFQTSSYSCPWLVYHSMIKTSKPFLLDVTECSIYALLLFGGSMEALAAKETIVIDRWVFISASARIASLLQGLRHRVDILLAEKVRNPFLDLAETQEMILIVKLIRTDGLGTF